MSHLFKLSLQSGTIPDIWTKANVTPIFKKKGSPNDTGNYRPISLTCVLCKVLESIISDKIRDFLQDKFFSGQHGFVKQKSTVSQLLESMSDWIGALEGKSSVDILYIDIAKAFDTVSHQKLLTKLKYYGITGSLLKWVEAFLSGRSQRVMIDGRSSDWANVSSGVPQGSILGPLLFLIYINDLPSFIENCTVKLFADDCKLYLALKRDTKETDRDLFQADIDKVSEWASKNQLNIAFSKCVIMHLGNKNPCFSYTLNEVQIPAVDSCCDLGVRTQE